MRDILPIRFLFPRTCLFVPDGGLHIVHHRACPQQSHMFLLPKEIVPTHGGEGGGEWHMCDLMKIQQSVHVEADERVKLKTRNETPRDIFVKQISVLEEGTSHVETGKRRTRKT